MLFAIWAYLFVGVTKLSLANISGDILILFLCDICSFLAFTLQAWIQPELNSPSIFFFFFLLIGATSFLFTEYKYVGLFMSIFAVLIFLFLGSVEGFSTKSQPCHYSKDKTCKPALANAIFSTIAFVLGAVTSLVSGFLGMKIATYANARTTLEARKGVGKAFITAFRSGAVMGFLLAASGLLVLYIAINLFGIYNGDDWEGLFEAITGYGLGGSSMALFGRVGGGIYTKAADVGADLVGKVERNIPEDDPRNPAVRIFHLNSKDSRKYTVRKISLYQNCKVANLLSGQTIMV